MVNAKVEYDINLKGRKNETMQFSLDEKSVPMYSFQVDGQFILVLIPPNRPKIEKEYNVRNNIYIADNIGIVQYESKSFRHTRKTLIHYYAK